jgi:hypothetical protein
MEKLSMTFSVTLCGIASLCRCRVALELEAPCRFDKALVRAVARANQWRELLESGVARTAHDLARHEGCRVSYIQRHMVLAFLAPDVVEAMVEGRQSKSRALNDLIKDTESRSWAGFRCR